MILKRSYLLPLYFATFFFSCTHGNGKSSNLSATKGKTNTWQTEKTVIMADTVTYQKTIRLIEEFYREYIEAHLRPGQQSTDSLIKKHLTKRLIEKISRMITTTGADPIIRAQDANEYMLKTIKARHLEDNWYMVEYDWYPDSVAKYDWDDSNDRGHKEIPLRVTMINGHYMIDYITPDWDGSSYGDPLLLNKFSQQPIDSSSPMSFLKTFYTAYTTEYCSVPEGLLPRLKALRKAHLMPKALAQFDQSANAYRLDCQLNYDLLIDGFDFDCLWIPNMTYKLIDSNTYQMRYGKSSALTLGVVKYGGEYKIAKVLIEK